jgi:hypothetical protein
MTKDSYAPWKTFVPGVWTRLFVVALGIAVLIFGRWRVYGFLGFIAFGLVFLLVNPLLDLRVLLLVLRMALATEVIQAIRTVARGPEISVVAAI